MDGVPAASLPPAPMPQNPGVSAAFMPPAPPGAGVPGQFPSTTPQPQPQRAPGRPSGDPESNAERERKHKQKQRLETILPAEMTDGRIAVYRLKGRRGQVKESLKPVMHILFRELEVAAEEGTKTGEFVRDRIIEKFGTTGRYLWSAQDNRGRPLTDYGDYEVNLDNNGEADLDDGEIDDEEVEVLDPPPRVSPPPPSMFNPLSHAREMKDLMADERASSQNTTTLMMTMMQQSTQMMMSMMQQQQQQADARRAEEERRREREESKEREERRMEMERLRMEQERREKEEQRREERERERTNAERQMQMQFITTMLNRPDTTTPMLMKMIDGKNDRDGTKELFTLMGEASRQSMIAQGESTKHLLSSQAEATKAMIANIMGISQQMVESMVAAQSSDSDDPMDKIGKVFNMLRPAMAAMSPQPALPAPAEAAVPQPQAQPAQAAPQTAAAQPSRASRPDIPDVQWTRACLTTIRRLAVGEIQPQNRLEALKWVAANLPPDMANAVRAGDQDQIMAKGAEALDDNLAGWLGDEQAQAFLQRALEDVQRILLGAMDRPAAQASMTAQAEHAKGRGQPFPAGAEKPRPEARRAPPPPAQPPMAEPVEPPKDEAQKPAEPPKA